MDAEETEELEEPREETREEKSNEYNDAVLLSLEKKRKFSLYFFVMTFSDWSWKDCSIKYLPFFFSHSFP